MGQLSVLNGDVAGGGATRTADDLRDFLRELVTAARTGDPDATTRGRSVPYGVAESASAGAARTGLKVSTY